MSAIKCTNAIFEVWISTNPQLEVSSTAKSRLLIALLMTGLHRILSRSGGPRVNLKWRHTLRESRLSNFKHGKKIYLF